MMRADGHQVSTSTVQRALRRRGLLLQTGFRADRKSWALLRKKVFHVPPTARNRVWQTDFSEFETTAGGIWRICAVIDYAAKYCLAVTIGPTSRAQDTVACLHAAIAEAERVTGLDDLRDDRGLMDIVDPDEYVLGQVPAPIAVVTDIGDGDALAVEVHRFRHLYNTIRPHQALADRTPAQVYTAPVVALASCRLDLRVGLQSAARRSW
jgi:putative transposase